MQSVIKEFPNYTVDELGVVRRAKTQRVIKQHIYQGYNCVLLYKGGVGKWKKVHRLVAEAFIPNKNEYPFVNHKDENKNNNAVDNLEWCTASYNNTYGENAPVKKMKEARAKAVVQYSLTGEYIATYQSATEAQRKTNINQSNISKCCRNEKNYKTAGNYIWKFENR